MTNQNQTSSPFGSTKSSLKVLVIGQGGREHAIVKALSQSAIVTEIHAIPGNPGMAKQAMCHAISWRDIDSIIQFCNRHEIDFVFIGPEDPLVLGLSDQLRERGILVVGPSKEAAMLEGSKIFAKHFMQEAKVPTADFVIVNSVASTLAAAKNHTAPFVLKADGLAAGKGVFICENMEALKIAAEKIFEQKIFGEAGEQAILEKNLKGWELSYIVLTNGTEHQTLPLAQDHKRLLDHNLGPNTGGMGTVAPLHITESLRKEIEEKIVKPSVALLKNRFYVYRGILFIGIMVTENGPQVLEYNVRFGDPETQVILPLLEGDLGKLFYHLSEGILDAVVTKNLYSSCVVMAAPGYPDHPERGLVISGDAFASTASSYFVHAGTARNQNSELVTNGGRVMGAIGLGSSLDESLQNAYTQIESAKWTGLNFRKDIGKYLG